MAPKGLEIKFDIRNIAKPRIAKGAGIFKLIYLWKLCIDPLTGKHQWHSKQEGIQNQVFSCNVSSLLPINYSRHKFHNIDVRFAKITWDQILSSNKFFRNFIFAKIFKMKTFSFDYWLCEFTNTSKEQIGGSDRSLLKTKKYNSFRLALRRSVLF